MTADTGAEAVKSRFALVLAHYGRVMRCKFGKCGPYVMVWYLTGRRWEAYAVCKHCRGNRVDFNLPEHMNAKYYEDRDKFTAMQELWLPNQTPSRNE